MRPYGLKIRSFLPLPGCDIEASDPDVWIQLGPVPDTLPGATVIRACTQARRGQFLLLVEHVARYLVEDGRKITIQPAPGVSDAELCLFLQGVVWSTLLLQRGLLPLHASAVRIKDQAVVLTGRSGNGKSTLAAALMEQGYPLLADEVCALVIQAGQPPLVLPGFPQVFLWADSLRKLGKDKHTLTPVRPGLEKYNLPCQDLQALEPVPLKRIYILALKNTPSLSIIPFTRAQNLHALIDWTYQVQQVSGLELSRPHFNQCALAAQHFTVKRVERPGIPFDVESLVRLVEEDCQ